ncbi:MAG: hypothetical protein A2Z83_00895 [Omnitrophica bacterium GWA2_52_8]|nr:MAG: hypothetical protein A2Z83_00895 [Omnitrophica bacterium GWA2_52_8]
MFYERIFKKLQKEKVRYLVAGGMAVNLYGVPRMTNDLDILIDPSDANIKRLKKAIKTLGYRPKIPVALDDFLKPENWIK